MQNVEKYTNPISIRNAAKSIETSTRKSSRKRLTDDEIGPISPLECLFCTGVEIEIRKICHERSDKCGNEVLSRINFYSDLHAKDCIYHQQCSLNFRTERESQKKKPSRTRREKFCQDDQWMLLEKRLSNKCVSILKKTTMNNKL